MMQSIDKGNHASIKLNKSYITRINNLKKKIKKKLVKKYTNIINRLKLRTLKGIHKEKQRCFIIGNGPSLSIDDLNLLNRNKEICFGSNKIYTIFSKTDWRPDYYACIDMLVYTQNYEEIMNSLCCKMFLNNKFRKLIPKRQKKQIIFLNYGGSYSNGCYFPRNGSHIYTGGTVTFVMIFLAWYMGFKNIYLIGCDNYMPSFEGKEIDTHIEYEKKMELDHFEGYLRENEIVNVGDFNLAEKGYVCAKEYIESKGGHIYNATRGGKLEVLDRVNFDDLFVL